MTEKKYLEFRAEIRSAEAEGELLASPYGVIEVPQAVDLNEIKSLLARWCLDTHQDNGHGCEGVVVAVKQLFVTTPPALDVAIHRPNSSHKIYRCSL